MENEPPSNRRRFPRVRTRCPLLALRSDGSAEHCISSTRVVGLGGLMFQCPHLVPPGTRLWLTLSVGAWTAQTAARVVYANPEGGSAYAVGVEYLGLGPADRAVLDTLFEPAA